MTKKKKTSLYFSLITGEIYDVMEDEEETLDRYQVPLRGTPVWCKHCFGKMHIGLNTKYNAYDMCKCSTKYIDFEKLKAKKSISV